MNAELKLQEALKELETGSPKRATVEVEAYAIIHLEDEAIRLEESEAALLLGSVAAIDLLCEVIDLGDDPVLTYKGVHIPDAVYGLLENIFSDIDEA